MTEACTPPQATILPSLIYPSTMGDAQRQLLAALRGTDATVQACAALDTPTRQSWGSFYAAALDFALADPGYFALGTRMDRAMSYGYALCQWQEHLQAAGCALTVPKFNPNPPSSDNFVKAVQYGSIAIAVGATAWIVGKLLELVPRPRARG